MSATTWAGTVDDMDDMDTGLMKPMDVARWWNVSRSWVYARAKAGDIPSVKVNGTLRFRRADLEAHLEANSNQGKP